MSLVCDIIYKVSKIYSALREFDISLELSEIVYIAKIVVSFIKVYFLLEILDRLNLYEIHSKIRNIN
jgi:hypothetical protein